MLQIKQLHGCESAYPGMPQKNDQSASCQDYLTIWIASLTLEPIRFSTERWMDNAAPSSSTTNFDLLALKVSVIPCYARRGASTSVIYTCCLFAFILNTETRIFYQSNFLLGLQAMLMWIPDSLLWFYAYWCRTNVIPHGTYRVLLSKFWK